MELYTKRNFRCDCGNSKFPVDNECTLNNDKNDLNELNSYNQNFSGMYCVCHRPFPDPEDPVPDEMIQVRIFSMIIFRISAFCGIFTLIV